MFFAENYAFVVQNAAQSFHWNNDQATIFTVLIYYKKDNILKHRRLPKENHAITAQELKSRFASSNTVPGTQKYHSFVPSAELTLMLRNYSSSSECDVFPKKSVRQRRKRSEHAL